MNQDFAYQIQSGTWEKGSTWNKEKKFPLNANPCLTESALDVWKEYIYKGKDFTRKFCKCNQFLHGKSLWNSRAESNGFPATGEE